MTDSDKIYVANQGSGSVSVIDGHNDTKIRDIGLGVHVVNKGFSIFGKYGITMHIIYDKSSDKIYVANPASNTVSVINGTTYSKIQDIHGLKIPVYSAIRLPNFLFSRYSTIYVANYGNHTVSEIGGNTKGEDIDIGVGHPSKLLVVNNKIFAIKDHNVSVICRPVFEEICQPPHDIIIYHPITAAAIASQIYIVNGSLPLRTSFAPVEGHGTVSVINAFNDRMEHDIPVGKEPFDIVAGDGKYYISNNGSNTVSVINGSTATKEPLDVPVGISPKKIAYDAKAKMIYVVNQGNVSIPTLQMAFEQDHINPFSSAGPGTVSVIDGSSDKVAAGVIFNVNPANSGRIICNNMDAPTNVYLYVDSGTNCTAQPNKDFGFNNWVENLPRNRNSSIPLYSSGNLTVNRYGTFTVNFKPLPPTIPPEYSFLIISVIISSLIGWSIPSIIGWVKARTQRKHLKECINQIGKLDKNGIEEKIIGYYIDGKLSDDHRQLLKDKISEYYENQKSSE